MNINVVHILFLASIFENLCLLHHMKKNINVELPFYVNITFTYFERFNSIS